MDKNNEDSCMLFQQKKKDAVIVISLNEIRIVINKELFQILLVQTDRR